MSNDPITLRPTDDDLNTINRILSEHDRPGLNLKPVNAIRIALAEWATNHPEEKMNLRIATLKHAYRPDLQGMEQPIIEEDVYDTLAEAVAVIEKWNSEVYVTDHNESGRPTYVVIDDRDAHYIETGRGEDMSNYTWTDEDEARCGSCGECQDCLDTMIAQDRDYLLKNALYKN
jgi:hypothetical protein